VIFEITQTWTQTSGATINRGVREGLNRRISLGNRSLKFPPIGIGKFVADVEWLISNFQEERIIIMVG